MKGFDGPMPAWAQAEWDLLEGLAALHPELRTLIDEHRADNDGYQLTTLVLAEIAWWVEARFRSCATGDVDAVLAHLELGFAAGDENLQTTIATGFVEALTFEALPEAGLRASLGPLLAEEYRNLVT